MQKSFLRRPLATLALAGLTLGTGATAALALPAPVPARAPLRLTENDVAASNEKVALAYRHLAATWQNAFARIGERFATPRLARYRGEVLTACGPMPQNNALYCPSRNTIYYDEVFVAAQAKQAARDLGTDGDMTAVGIVAHEMGHAVAMQLGEASRVTYENEATADCLAGAFAKQADTDGALEPGDVEEAFYGMAAAADPQPELTGNARLDRRIQLRAALMGHGTREQRQSNFRAGLRGGAGACVEAFAR